MNRLLLALCLLTCTVSGTLGALYWQGRDRQLELIAARDSLDNQLTSSRQLASSFQKQANQLATDLATTQGRLLATEERATQVTRDLASARATLAAREQAERTLRDELASLRRDLADTRATAIPPAQAEAYRATIAELERQLATAKNGAALTTAAGASTAVFSSRPAPTSAAVVSVGPESAFVVLNYGAVRGARVGQRFTLRQGADILATAAISDVRTQFSVAQVEPDSLRGVLHKGDLALLTP